MSLTTKMIIMCVIIALVTVLVCMLIGMRKKQEEAQAPTEETNEQDDEQVELYRDSATQYIDNILALAGYVNKTPDLIGVNEAELNADFSREIRYSGKLFGYDAHAQLMFTTGTPQIASGAYIHCHEISFHECRDELIKIYGEPLFEDENPYVESLGGVVTTCRFETDELKINLSMASNYDYIDIDIRAK